MISVMILVGHQHTSCVCLKAPVKLKPVQKLLRKINTAPIPNKCLFEMKGWAQYFGFGCYREKERNTFCKWTFRRSGSLGDSHIEGGADQRLRTACLLGQDTNSHKTLATAPSLNRVHLENTEASVLAREVCRFAFNTFSPPFCETEAKAEKHYCKAPKLHIHTHHTHTYRNINIENARTCRDEQCTHGKRQKHTHSPADLC